MKPLRTCLLAGLGAISILAAGTMAASVGPRAPAAPTQVRAVPATPKPRPGNGQCTPIPDGAELYEAETGQPGLIAVMGYSIGGYRGQARDLNGNFYPDYNWYTCIQFRNESGEPVSVSSLAWTANPTDTDPPCSIANFDPIGEEMERVENRLIQHYADPVDVAPGTTTDWVTYGEFYFHSGNECQRYPIPASMIVELAPQATPTPTVTVTVTVTPTPTQSPTPTPTGDPTRPGPGTAPTFPARPDRPTVLPNTGG